MKKILANASGTSIVWPGTATARNSGLCRCPAVGAYPGANAHLGWTSLLPCTTDAEQPVALFKVLSNMPGPLWSVPQHSVLPVLA